MLMRSAAPGAAILLILAAAAASAADDWKPLHDGKTLDGWKETPFTGRGRVEVKDGAIVLGSGYMTGVTWTRDFPKAGYEIRFQAMRVSGNDFFAGLTFPVKDSFCTWINGGWGGSMVGLSSIDGEDASENETSTGQVFENGRWYSFRLQVTAARIRAWIDEEPVIDIDIEGRRIDLRPGEIDLSAPLGFASYATTAAVRRIEYRMLDK